MITEMNQVIPQLRTLLHAQRLYATNKNNAHGDLRGLESETTREDVSQYLVKSGQKKMEINAMEEDIQQFEGEQGELNALGKADVVCYACKKKGHYKDECRDKPLPRQGQASWRPTCFNCDKTGHRARECRLPKKNGSGYSKEKRNGDRDKRSDLGKKTTAIDRILTKITTMEDRISKVEFLELDSDTEWSASPEKLSSL